MATINPDQLLEFKKIFKEDYGQEFVDDDEAMSAALNLVGFFEILMTTDQKKSQENGASEIE
jgi:hypothetical protein